MILINDYDEDEDVIDYNNYDTDFNEDAGEEDEEDDEDDEEMVILEIVKVLCNNGADVNAKNDQDRSPVDIALEHGAYRLLNHLIPFKASIPIWGQNCIKINCLQVLNK